MSQFDAGQTQYQSGPPAREKVEFCIQQLEESGADPTREIAAGLTVEEVAGALLHARDELEGNHE